MIHVARRVLGAIVVVAIVAGATLALSSRPRLDSDRRAVEREWHAVRGPLIGRYTLVDQLALAVEATGGPANPLVAQIKTTFTTWKALKPDAPVASSIAQANTLEGLTRRLVATVIASPILRADPAVKAALPRVASSQVPPGVAALNAAVSRYENDRGGPVRRLAAGPLGFDAIPRLTPATGPVSRPSA